MNVFRELFGSPGKFSLSFVWLFFPFAVFFGSAAMTTTGYTPWRDLPEILPIYLLSSLVLWGQVVLLRRRVSESSLVRGFCIAAGLLVLPVFIGIALGPIVYVIALIVYASACPRVTQSVPDSKERSDEKKA